MTPSVVRPATEADWPAIAGLLDRILGARPLDQRLRLWRWRSERNPAQQAGFPAFLVAERAGEIVGVHGLMPVRLKVGGSEVVAACACDFAVDPAARGVGLALKLKATDRSLAPVALSTSANEQANKLALALKGKQLDRAALSWIKPLRSAGLIGRRFASPSLRTAAQAGLAAPDLGLRAWRALRQALRSRHRSVEAVTTFDRRHDALWQRMATGDSVMLVRDAAYLQWRYADYPFGGIEMYQIVNNGAVLGIAALHHARDTDGLTYTSVLDLYDAGGDARVLGALLDRVLIAADRNRSHYVTAKATAAAHDAAYSGAGFMARHGAYSPFTYVTRDPGLSAAIDRPHAWVIALGDGDLSFHLP